MKKFIVRIFSFVLATSMALSCVPTVSAYGNVSSWAEEEVGAMEDLGLIPESLEDADLTGNITRLDMCRIAVLSYENLLGTIELSDSHPFLDTQDPDAEKAYQVGLAAGRGDGKFYPDDTLNRSEFFAFVVKFLNAVGYPVSESDYADLSGFDDVNTIPDWVVEYVQLAVGLGIVNGTGNSLDWASETKAEQAIAMFYRAYCNALISELDPPCSETPTEDPTEDSTEDPIEISADDFINLSSWAEESVLEMAQMGLVPDSVKISDMTGSITRGDMCTIAVLSYCAVMDISIDELDCGSSPFIDTDDFYIVCANKLGIVNGYTDGTFLPDKSMTRQEYFKICVNFLNAVGYEYTDAKSVDLSQYADGSAVADYAKPCARLLIAIGVVKGDTDKKLNPTIDIVCQEALVIFNRIIHFMEAPFAPMEGVEDEGNADTGSNNSSGNNSGSAILSSGQAIAEYASQFVGYRYVPGGQTPKDGFDCSGLVYYVYKQFGYTLPRTATTQWTVSSTIISKTNLQPGDIVFFAEPKNMTPSGIFHVGIYIGENQIVHAANSNSGVIISKLTENYYAKRFLGGKRVVQ